MLKRTAFFAFSLLLLGSFLQNARAQAREITAEEYRSAYFGAQAVSHGIYPRIETYSSSSEKSGTFTSRRSVESTRRSHTVIEVRLKTGIRLSEWLDYDGEKFERAESGIWLHRALPKYGMMSDHGSGETKYTVEEITESGNKIKLYTETIKQSGDRTYVTWAKVDSEGKMLEYDKRNSSLSHMIYEFPETVPPIKKPILGSNKDI